MANGNNWGVGDDVATGFFGTVADLLQTKVKQQQDNDQKMKEHTASIYTGVISSGGVSSIPGADNSEVAKEARINFAQEQLQKLYGNSKPMKELFQKFGNVLHVGKHAIKQQQAPPGGPTPPPTMMGEQTPIGGSSTQPPGMMPATMRLPGKTPPPGGATPIPPGTNANPSGAPPTAPMGGPTPPPTFASLAAGLPNKSDQEFDLFSREQDVLHRNKMSEESTKPKRLQKAVFKDPASGEIIDGSYDGSTGDYLDQQGRTVKGAIPATTAGSVPKPIQYMGPNGEAIPGNYVNGKYLDRDGKELPEGTIMFHPSLSPTDTTTTTVRIEKDASGNYVEIPVTSTSVKTRGGASGGPTPPPKSGAAPSAGGTSRPRASGGRGGGGTGQARVITGPDGKPLKAPAPTEVKKAYDAYNAAQERYAVMADALPRAQKGDQQAMVNLLANHIGMTMGLQKGARITQSIYDEAAQSSPVLGRIKAHFDSRGYLTGVVLTPEQMTQMIDLAQVRLDQDKKAWQREVGAAKSGYGMTGDTPSGSTPPPKPPPKTADEFFQRHPVGGP